MSKPKKEVGLIRKPYKERLYIFGEQTTECIPPKNQVKDFPFTRVKSND